MNKLKLLIFMSLMPYAVFSQIKIKGRILDLNDKPIEFAEITLLQKDSVAFKSEFSSENGYFDLEIKAGNYILSIRQLGNIFYKDTLNAIKNIDLGLIKVKNSNILDEVTVVTKKK